MSDLIRDAPMGQLIRYFTKNRLLKYPEERPDFQCPASYRNPEGIAAEVASIEGDEIEKPHIERERPATPDEPTIEEGKEFVEPRPTELAESTEEAETPPLELEQIPTAQDRHFESIKKVHTTRTTAGVERVSTRSGLQHSVTRADLEEQFTKASLAVGPSRPIIPEKLEDGTILVDWYTTDDPDNPQNWSLGKKCFVASQICFCMLQSSPILILLLSKC